MEKRINLKSIGTVLIALLLAFIFFKYVLTLILPFLIAFFIAFLVNFPLRILKKRTKLSSKILSAILVSAMFFIVGFALFLITNRLFDEARQILSRLAENSDAYVQGFFNFINGIADKLPFINAVGADLADTVSEVVRSMLTDVTTRIPGIIAKIISMAPHILLFTVVIILASYYFGADYDIICRRILDLLPVKAQEGLHTFKQRLTTTGVKYLKACFIIMVITYFEVLIGFIMLDIPYSFTLSFIVAAVDMLPIFGVGTVLVPFAIWCFISGDTYTAIGLMIIFGVISIVRQFIEPKIIGQGIGLSPITTLFSMYIGFRLLGFAGLLLSPIITVLIVNALPEKISSNLITSNKNDKNLKF